MQPSTELVVLEDGNPLNDLRREDGTWSARDVQASGHVHAEWRKWHNAIKRGYDRVVFLYGGNVSAAQDHFVRTDKMIEIGKGAQREVVDYALTALGLFASCQQAQLPELDLWFTFAGLQAAGYGSWSGQPQAEAVEERQEVGVTNLVLPELTAILSAVGPGPAQDRLLALAMMKLPKPPPPPYTGPPPPDPSTWMGRHAPQGPPIQQPPVPQPGPSGAAYAPRVPSDGPEFTPGRKQGNHTTP